MAFKYPSVYKNIAAVTVTTLITKRSGISGDIDSITITNHDDSDSNTIRLHLYDGTNTYVIAETVIPPRVSLLLTENIQFDAGVYDLRMATTSDADITVIIK
jgi:hypothetical protein